METDITTSNDTFSSLSDEEFASALGELSEEQKELQYHLAICGIQEAAAEAMGAAWDRLRERLHPESTVQFYIDVRVVEYNENGEAFQREMCESYSFPAD